jgi:tripartite-type tricarboxylate transporter receptor subunit TctC
MTHKSFKFIPLLAAAFLACAGSSLQAQPYPSRPVHLYVPIPAGGGVDILARAVGRMFTERTGQPFIVENRPGGNFTIAMQACANAKPDGYVACLTLRDNVSISPFQEKQPYDVLRDFTPVTQLVYLQNVMVANAQTPFNTFGELVTYSKANPDKVNYTAFGASVAILAWLNRESGARLTYVPYKGAPDALPALMNNTIQVMYLAIGNPTIVNDVNSGRLKGLAVPGDTRNPLMPKVPSFADAGLPPFATKSWLGILMPAGAPRDAVTRLSAELSAIVNDPAFRDKNVTPFGFDAVGSTPDQFAKFIVEDRKAGAELAKLAGKRE